MYAFKAFYSENKNQILFKKTEENSPKLNPKDLLVKIEAVGLNPVDYKVASGLLNKPNELKTLGWDASGIIVELGTEVKNFKIGDHVYYAGAIDRPGSNSQYQVVDERIVGQKPKSLTFKEAAALPLTAITAYEALFTQLQISKNISDKPKKVLLGGAAGGVGSIAIQLLKSLTSSIVIATASRIESENWVKSLGADYVINHNKDFLTELNRIGLSDVDYIFCINGLESHFINMANSIKTFGKIVTIDDPVNPLDMMLLKMKSVSFSWEFMFTHSLYQTEDMISQHKLLNEISQLVDLNKIKSTIGLDLGIMTEVSLEKSHELLKTQKTIGKIVLGINE
ncbi:MAG: zinc-binding alcohol dehydrogenase family protein [Silvanigrellaceae bacterium]|nr:zinc-binding alcohol dehydrogenase family protein [Silvanigrellaceae bacterium]